MQEAIRIKDLAAALSCHPRTLSRLMSGGLSPPLSAEERVYLADAARLLKMDAKVLSQFVTAKNAGQDEALDMEFAMMVTGLGETTIKRRMQEGKIVPLVHVNRILRFSRKALANLSD